jgi:hypothetical protein
MKAEDCNKNQIFYPKTKRCINKDSKKALEYLFNIGDEAIHKIYEEVDGKIIKRCEKPKIRNPETKRCVNPKSMNLRKTTSLGKKTEVMKKSASLGKKIEALKKAKRALLPFKNRVSADIYHRNKYLVLMRRELRNKKEGCMKIYKKKPDGTFLYRIGNRIILNKRIGSNSVYGIVYLSEFREKEKKMFTFASKVYGYVEKKAKMELELLTKMTDLVRMDMCPHFPILYGYVICNNILNNKDSFIESKGKKIAQDITNFPEIIKKNINSKIITTFNELANGDLWNFFEIYSKNMIFLANAIIQQFLSIMFFNYHTSRIHMDTHPGNFLYHKITPGGYFHYNLFGFDYYLENIGILWVIWDFDLSKTLDEAIKYYQYKRNKNDYKRILSAYLPEKYEGYCQNRDISFNKSLFNLTYGIYNHQNSFFIKKPNFLSKMFLNRKEEDGYNSKSLKEYIINLPLILSSVNLDGKNILLRKLPTGAKVINKNPYKMTKEELFK